MSAVKGNLSVIILDDEKNVETAIQQKLPTIFRRMAASIKPDDITVLVKALGARAVAARASRKRSVTRLELDAADLFIVDYDLVKAKNEDYLTGEMVAYLARCYSGCGGIVALNQFYREPTFDLTLRPQLDSFADLNISAADLANPGLWTDPVARKGYRPWSWPVIPELIKLFEKRVSDVLATDHRKSVVEFLEFPTSAIERLPTAVLELLGGQGSRAENATLSDIVRSPHLGLRGREATDRKRQREQNSRIVAARLSAWLNLVLSPQDVLVDAPHLAQRCPSLVGDRKSVATFNKTCILKSDEKVFSNPLLLKTKIRKHFWFDRPVWFWTEVERLRIPKELQDPWHGTDDRFVFCEDTSSFGQRIKAKSFQSDLISPYRTRFVSRVAHVDYQPAHRLALA
jgi:hypothetical protein